MWLHDLSVRKCFQYHSFNSLAACTCWACQKLPVTESEVSEVLHCQLLGSKGIVYSTKLEQLLYLLRLTWEQQAAHVGQGGNQRQKTRGKKGRGRRGTNVQERILHWAAYTVNNISLHPPAPPPPNEIYLHNHIINDMQRTPAQVTHQVTQGHTPGYAQGHTPGHTQVHTPGHTPGHAQGNTPGHTPGMTSKTEGNSPDLNFC